MKKKYQEQGLQVIGIHTPEFSYEKERARVVQAAKRYGLDHPIMMDNDYGYWRALGNRYWPTFYLVDPKGKVIMQSSGEIHEGDGRAIRFENAIKKMLSSL